MSRWGSLEVELLFLTQKVYPQVKAGAWSGCSIWHFSCKFPYKVALVTCWCAFRLRTLPPHCLGSLAGLVNKYISTLELIITQTCWVCYGTREHVMIRTIIRGAPAMARMKRPRFLVTWGQCLSGSAEMKSGAKLFLLPDHVRAVEGLVRHGQPLNLKICG
jgi:hypothetical protein